MYKEQISLFEKLLAAASYVTFGTIGFIWLLFSYFTKNEIKSFLRYHIFQSVFISILYFIVSSLLGIFMYVLAVIPIINELTAHIYYWLNMPLIAGFSIINTIIYLMIIYLVFTSLQGKYSYLPWVSGIIKENLKR